MLFPDVSLVVRLKWVREIGWESENTTAVWWRKDMKKGKTDSEMNKGTAGLIQFTVQVIIFPDVFIASNNNHLSISTSCKLLKWY